ncbi:MAG: cofactor-independent phosphoglycerate mutase [ANME-2 cluster archaeon]|nr:cofactor-independent phosphoglycerate mutase [ANME-2 cluster archaeon]
MKYIVLLGDGMADYPLDELGGLTPLQAASTPNMDRMAKQGQCGLAQTVPADMPPGSDVANLSILGYDPAKYYSGRGPLEAASMGVDLASDDIAFRCNLITEKDGVIADYSASHISTEEAEELIGMVDDHLGSNNVRFHAGISYRHLLVLSSGKGQDAKCTPPHDQVGGKVADFLPKGQDAELLNQLIMDSKPLLEAHEINRRRTAEGKNMANMIWPWAQGRAPQMPHFRELYGISGAMISAVDLLKGLGVCTGLKVIDVPGATGYLDTNYEGKADAALHALGSDDFVYVHVEAADEAAHIGDVGAKIQAIEKFDLHVVGNVLDGLAVFDDYTVLLMPDHSTPIPVKTHTHDPVPFVVLSSSGGADDVTEYNEFAVKSGSLGIVEGHRIMNYLIKGEF